MGFESAASSWAAFLERARLYFFKAFAKGGLFYHMEVPLSKMMETGWDWLSEVKYAFYAPLSHSYVSRIINHSTAESVCYVGHGLIRQAKHMDYHLIKDSFLEKKIIKKHLTLNPWFSPTSYSLTFLH